MEAILVKKFFKGIWNLIRRHKLLFLICLFAIVITISMMYIFFSMFIGNSGKYGDRLDGIEEVELSETELNDIADKLEEKDEVTAATVRVQGKIIYIHIEVKRETSLARAKELASISLEEFTDEEKSFYDFGFSLTQEEEEGSEDTGFIVTGSKHAKLDSISWIKS